MALDEYIKNVDSALGKQWQDDKESLKYTEDEARVASVLTRMDTGLIASLLSYNAKTLDSIKLGIWALVAINVVDLFIQRL